MHISIHILFQSVYGHPLTHKSQKMGFLDLFQVAVMPVLEVLLITALGSILALDSVGVLGHNSRKSLNTLVFFVFSPALVGSYLAKTVTFEGLALLWFMPLNILFTYIFGSALGWILLKIAKPPQHLNGLLISSCSAANLGNLPLIIIPAICRQKGSPFGAPDICHKYGMTYASLAMAVGAVYLWSYVYNIVRVSASSSNHDEIDDIAEAFVGSSEPLLHHDFGAAENVSLSVMIQKSFKGFQRKIHLKALLAPSTVGAIVGFAIGVIPLLRKSIIGGDAPLHVIEDSAILLGDSTTPALTLILGANLLKGLRGSGSGVKPSLIVGIILIRYVLLPVVGIAIIKGAIYIGVLHTDPLYQFVLLLQYALPPALNIGTVTQLFGAGESECSVIMLWTYASASVSLTLWSTYFMWLVA